MLRAVLKRDSTHVTLCKGMDFNESQLRTRSINLAAEATEDNQDAHSQEPSEIQTTHQDSISCFQSGNFMLARGASNTNKCLLHFIAAFHEYLQNSRTAYEIQLHLTRVTTTTNTKKNLCCPTKHHDIETPLLRCHHKYTESVLSHHPPRARENRVGVMNTSHQAETADVIQFTFSLEPCEMSKQ